MHDCSFYVGKHIEVYKVPFVVFFVKLRGLSVFKLSISVILICARYSKYGLKPQRRKMVIIDRFAEI